jgi:hypothetical protein
VSGTSLSRNGPRLPESYDPRHNPSPQSRPPPNRPIRGLPEYEIVLGQAPLEPLPSANQKLSTQGESITGPPYDPSSNHYDPDPWLPIGSPATVPIGCVGPTDCLLLSATGIVTLIHSILLANLPRESTGLAGLLLVQRCPRHDLVVNPPVGPSLTTRVTTQVSNQDSLTNGQSEPFLGTKSSADSPSCDPLPSANQKLSTQSESITGPRYDPSSNPYDPDPCPPIGPPATQMA